MRCTTLFFDLDDTIYPNDTGLWDVIRSRMTLYIVQKLGMPEDQAMALRREYYTRYGTTLRGLQIHHGVDADAYLEFVHDINLEDYLKPSPELRSLLLSLPQKRWIFTNASSEHAGRVLERIGLAGCFTGLIDIRLLGFSCKPEVEAYRRALAISGESNPGNCMILDDSPTNLVTALELGFGTVLVSANGKHPAANYSVRGLLELPAVLPGLWDEV